MMNSRVSILNKMQQNEDLILDPLQANQLIFQQKIFLPLVLSDQQDAAVTPLIFKITRQKNLDRLVIYILSQLDLYFLYRIELSYEQMTELNIEFKLSLKKLTDFVEFMKISLEDIQNQTKMGLVQIIKTQGEQILVFELKRQMGGKSHLVMKLQGKREEEEIIKHRVAYEYGSIRQRITKKEERIEQLKEMVRLKNPYLLKNFKQL